MRDYGKVSPQFWVGKTGKALRGDLPAQILALYLMTSPHANMIGIYYCPIEYMAKETGLSIEGASKALRSLISADFCTYETDDELIFVHAFAEHQIGESLKAGDKRVIGVINELEKVPKNQCWRGFRARYAVPYNLPVPGKISPKPASPSEAPSKPETETGSEEETETGSESSKPPAKRATPTPAIAKPDDVDPQTWADWCQLRKAKRATVSLTVIDGARDEAAKAGMSLEPFLKIWCRRGSQGLDASWLKPDERGAGGETAYQRSMREKMEVMAPAIAAKAPGVPRTNPNNFFDALPNAKPLEITQ